MTRRAVALALLAIAAIGGPASAGEDGKLKKLNVACGNLIQFRELDKARKPCKEALERALKALRTAVGDDDPRVKFVEDNLARLDRR